MKCISAIEIERSLPENCLEIYTDFITYHRNYPPSQNAFTEIHHIKPKCIGGSNDPVNLLPLLPEHHMDAHLLLAKGHNHKGLWQAYWTMVNVAGGHHGSRHISARLDYSEIIANRPVGSAHYLYDNKIHSLQNLDGRTFTGTQWEFSALIQKSKGNINMVISGKRKSVSGWFLVSTDQNTIGKGVKGEANPRYDTSVWIVRHIDKGVFQGNRCQVAEHTGLPASTVNQIVNRHRKSAHGWVLDGTDIALIGKGKRRHVVSV